MSFREDNFHHHMQISNQPLQIQVQKATEFLDEPTKDNIQKYPMRSSPRGLVLIINNIHFQFSNEKPRISAEHDEVNLQQLFEDMGFKVIVHRDLTTQVSERILIFSLYISSFKPVFLFIILGFG